MRVLVKIVLWLAGLGAVAVATRWVFVARVRRLFASHPLRRIGDASDGQPGTVVGTIVDGESFPAPLSGRRCVYAEIEVSFHVRGSKRPHTVAFDRRIPFSIEDDTGRTYVDPADAEVVCEADHWVERGAGERLSRRERAVIDRAGLTGARALQRGFRLREHVLAVGERVAISGTVVHELDPTPVAAAAERGYREGPPTRGRVVGTARAPLRITDVRQVTDAAPR
ncbi:MAG: GIDE domain-containing protein [Kofleriaceae bacterium]